MRPSTSSNSPTRFHTWFPASLSRGSRADATSIPVRPEFFDPDPDGAFACRPFGITWTPDELYIANHRQLLVFDRQLSYGRTLRTPLQINVHQLAYRAGRVWAVSPRTNSLIGVCPKADPGAVEFDLLNQKLSPYIPRFACGADDKHHFNSLLWANGYLFVAAHNFSYPSFINWYEEHTLHLEYAQFDVGMSIHNLALYNEELFWISTRTCEICSSLGYVHQLPKRGYPRGFAMTPRNFVVATSEFLHRDQRRRGDSWIQVIDRQQRAAVSTFCLRDTGGINDLRLLDEYDYAHCVDPFWDETDRSRGAVEVTVSNEC